MNANTLSMYTKPSNNLHTRVIGRGERLVFIHGSNIASTKMLWSHQYELATDYTLVIPDRRGYGLSTGREDEHGYESNVDDILALLQDEAHLIGHSYGALLSMVAATRRPELVKSLTLIEPPAFSVARSYSEVEYVINNLQQVYANAHTPERFLAGFLSVLNNVVMEEPSYLFPWQAKAVLTTMMETEPWNIPLALNELSQCPFPKLIVSGNWHPALMICAKVLVQELGAEHYVVNGVGHDIQKVGQPFNERLKQFLSSATKDLVVSPVA